MRECIWRQKFDKVIEVGVVDTVLATEVVFNRNRKSFQQVDGGLLPE
jgi:hypothetical protein